MINNSVKLAVVQAAPVYLNADATVDKTIALIEEAAANGADLLAFPEVWISGYPWWAWLGAPAWGAQFLPRLYASAVAVNGPELERIRQAALANKIHVVLGFSEKMDATLYISQVAFSDEGQLLFHRRKLKPTHVERTVYGEGDGSDLTVVDTKLGRLGALCCAEHVQPLSKFALFAQNEQIHVASWPSFTLYKEITYGLTAQANLAVSQVHAIEGGCYVLHSSAVTSKEMIELLCDTEEKVGLLNADGAVAGGGCSMIYGPDGKPLVELLPEDAEGILYADAHIEAIVAAKSVFDPAGHYCRADATQLLLNVEPRQAVVKMGGAAPTSGEASGDPTAD
ncbi:MULTISPECIES: carbon-nitrogen hydrolase family protein [unclassified Novosphingobium]|nr:MULTISPECIES: carbon-nitrogen hydrolase family protein [unclassified Novosphingobium]NKJ45056.1 aliphatic nitrilase [Novosphingobium sp. SG720]NMN07627.1 aliphatic nitrilase [Novosphingobium sp. SG919]NMN89937.1 aliphatic nitrilase [Novosphingobium sp. SG916]